MVNRNLIRELDLGDELEQEIDLAMGGSDAADFDVGQRPLLQSIALLKERFYELTMNLYLLMLGTRVRVTYRGTNGMKQNPHARSWGRHQGSS